MLKEEAYNAIIYVVLIYGIFRVQTNSYPAQRGNVLFLILIAVALFAALSYAVTSSSRSGGGSSERERIKLDVSTAINALVSINTEIVRKSINGDAIELSTNPGGIHEPGVGIPVVHPPLSLRKSMSGFSENFFSWRLLEAPILVNGVDLGSSDADITISLCGLKVAACEEFNKELRGDSTMPTINNYPVYAMNFSQVYRDGSLLVVQWAYNSIDVADRSPACMLNGAEGKYCAYFYSLER